MILEAVLYKHPLNIRINMNKLLLLIACLLIQNCSVSTAMKGKELPDLSEIKIGADYHTLNQILGEPYKFTTLKNGKRLHIYKNLAGLDPNMIDFVPNFLLDIITLGMWEITPYHDSKFKEYYITYDENKKVDSINKYIPPATQKP